MKSVILPLCLFLLATAFIKNSGAQNAATVNIAANRDAPARWTAPMVGASRHSGFGVLQRTHPSRDCRDAGFRRGATPDRNSWRVAYAIEGIRGWLFQQHK